MVTYFYHEKVTLLNNNTLESKQNKTSQCLWISFPVEPNSLIHTTTNIHNV